MTKEVFEKYREYLGKLICGVFIICLLWLVLDYNDILNHKRVNHTLEAGVYIDGIKTEDISVIIEGKYYPHLFKSDVFGGRFVVPYIAETMGDSITANIVWYDKKGNDRRYQYQLISYDKNGGEIQHINIKGTYIISINRSMDEFVWVLESGEVIATSDEMYLKHTTSINTIK